MSCRKLKRSWLFFLKSSKNEIKDTIKIFSLLMFLFKGGKLTTSEIKYIKLQSGDLFKIVLIILMSLISIFIPIILNKILIKFNIDIFPRDRKHLLEKNKKINGELKPVG